MMGSGNHMKLAILLLTAVITLRPQEISHTTEPKPIHTVRSQYTKVALAAKIEGDVILSLMVGLDGVPSDIKLVRGLGMGLDEKAVECLQQWRFKPATNDFSEPVSAKATVVVNFRLPQPLNSK
jgi:TonB family protein